MIAWIYLIVAGICEICWAIGLEHSGGFRLNYYFVFVVVSMCLSLVFLSLAIKTIPLSIAYAVWTGIGVLGVVIYGIFVQKEPISLQKIIFIGLILTGIIGLKLDMK